MERGDLGKGKDAKGIKKTSWNWSSSHWKPRDGNEGERRWRNNEEREVCETYANRGLCNTQRMNGELGKTECGEGNLYSITPNVLWPLFFWKGGVLFFKPRSFQYLQFPPPFYAFLPLPCPTFHFLLEIWQK